MSQIDQLKHITAIQMQGEHQQAKQLYKEHLETYPESELAWANLSHLYYQESRLDLAYYHAYKALAAEPACISAYNILGLILIADGKPQQGSMVLELGLSFEDLGKNSGNNRDLYSNLWKVQEEHCDDIVGSLRTLRRYSRKHADDGEALADFIHNTHKLFFSHMPLENDISHLRSLIEAGNGTVKLFPLLALFDDRALLKRAAENRSVCLYADELKDYPKNSRRTLKSRQASDKIKVGYISGDVGLHPVSHMTAHLYQSHNRDEFEISVYALNSVGDNIVYKHIMAKADKSYSLHDMPISKASAILAENDLDIIVDLSGHTSKTAKPLRQLLCRRPATAAISYLGFIGTMGMPYHDYIVADKYLIPESHRSDYTEEVLYVDCLYAYRRMFLSRKDGLNKQDFGLPEETFIFASFQGFYKINERVFSAWMQILQTVDNACLWLQSTNDIFRANFIAAAAAYGIDSQRLIFCDKDDVSHYQARYDFADLILDTFPYNGGMTSTDALYSACPMLTLPGNTMISRVGMSLLKQVEMQDFIAENRQDYIQKACYLANNPEKLRAAKSHLQSCVPASTIFDGDNMTRQLESHYRHIVSLHAKKAQAHV